MSVGRLESDSLSKSFQYSDIHPNGGSSERDADRRAVPFSLRCVSLVAEETGQCFVSQDHKEEVTCVSFNANDSCVASGSTSGDLVLHSLTTNLSSRAFGHGSQQVPVTSDP